MTDDEKLALLDELEAHEWQAFERLLHLSEPNYLDIDEILPCIERCQRIRANLQTVQCGGEGCLCRPLIDLWKDEPDLVDTDNSSLPDSGWTLT